MFSTGVGDEFGYVIELDPDSPWTWRDLDGEQSDAPLIEDPTEITIVARVGVDLHPSSWERESGIPAGPLRSDRSRVAWLTRAASMSTSHGCSGMADIAYTQRFQGTLNGEGVGPTSRCRPG